MKILLRTFLLTAVAAAYCSPSWAGVILTTTSYSENFDEPKLSNTGVTGQWTALGAQAAVPGTSGWDGVRVAGSGASMNYVLSDGSANSGAIYSYGATGSTERALGSLASGSNTPAVGLELNNGLGLAIKQVTINYKAEFWRSSTTTQNVLTFGYLAGAAGSTTYLTDASTAVAALNLVGPAPVTTNGPLNGNDPANQAAFGATFDVNVPAGQSLYIRWQDFNDVGNDAGLAIDDISLSVVTVPEPSAVVLGCFGMLGLLFCGNRRS